MKKQSRLMPRRAGATLVEVLVAMFVMAIGLLAILVLFPLGVYRMAQAIQDGRMANISQSADSTATIWNVRRDAKVIGPPNLYTNPPGTLPADAFGPGFPVFIDPAGLRTSNSPQVAGLPWVPRASPSFIANAKNPDYAALRWFSLLDDIIFNTQGGANIIAGNQFEREIRYSWGYLCQMPKSNDLSVINLAVVAYNRRTLALGGGGLSLPEYAYGPGGAAGTAANFNTTGNIITVTYGAGNPLPPVRPGEWILDATPFDATGKVNPGAPTTAHGYFYRVVSINDLGGSVEYEVQTPLRGWPPSATNAGTAVVLEGVAEVFERSDGRAP